MQDHPVEMFDNAGFWDERYRTNMELGSGAGSRGRFLSKKQRILQDAIASLQPGSILDVGCGDLKATRHLRFDGVYTGIDLSSYVIARNRLIRPDWDFVHGDFIAWAHSRQPRADLVFCLDVLIHQHDRETYRAFVRELLLASCGAVVVNGFDTVTRPNTMSPNVAFHEPLSRTLRESGGEVIERLASFRRTSIVMVAGRGPASRCRPGDTVATMPSELGP